MKIKPLLPGIAISLFFLIFAALVFLPAVLSSNMLKPHILQSVNRHLPGQLRVEEWTFKWFSGIAAKGIVYDHQQENFSVKVDEVTGYHGLVHIMASAGSLGGIEVIRPHLVFYLSDKSQPDPPEQTASSRTGIIPVFSGILKVTDGSIHTLNAAGSEKTVIKDLDLFVDMSDVKKPITYRVFLTSADAVGRLSGKGTMTLPADQPFDLKAVQSDARLKITNWELEDVLAILASRGDYPAGKGRLNADLSLQRSTADSLGLAGNLSLNRLELWGGPLGTDHPRLKGVAADIDGTISHGVLSLHQLRFQSSVADGSAQGSFGSPGQKQFQSAANINLAEVFTQLPDTFKLRKHTSLSEGKLVWSANIQSTDEITAFESTARIDKLKGVSKGKPIAWNQPVSLRASGQKSPQGLRIDSFSLRSSFLSADGQGDLDNMRITLSADLAAALGELKKFVAINAWNGSGKLFARLQVGETSPGANTGSLNLDIRNLALSRHGRPVLPSQNVKADLTATVRKNNDSTVSEFQEPNLSIQSKMVRGKFSAGRITFNAGENQPATDNLSIDGNFNLQQISDLLRNVGKLPGDTRLAGNAHVQTGGSMEARQLVLNNTRIEARDLRYRNGQRTAREKRFVLKTKGLLNFKTKSALLAPVDISGSAGTITIPELAIRDWSNFQNDLKTQAKANLDLAELTAAYGDFIPLPAKTSISGNGAFDLDVDFSSPATQFLKIDADLAPFQLASDSLPPISEDHVKLRADLKRSQDGKTLSIENIQLNSTPLSLSAAGNLDQAGQNKTLDAQGNINLDLAMLSPYLRKIAGPQITITGKGDNPFTLKMITAGTRWTDALRNTTFTGAVRADSIDAFGLGISATEVPIQIANESAIARLGASANGGRLELQPTIDLRREPYMLSLPPDSTILKDVEITDAMAAGLMSKIHPVFQGSVQAQGHVDLVMQHFKWALDKKDRDKTAFAGTLHLKGARINSTNLLSGLLNLIGVNGNEMNFGDLDIDFVARNGRIETSPIRLEIDGYPVELRGSAGFDKSLDYIARFPITPKLVGNKAYRYLEGVTIDVPIRGSASNPDIDERTMRKASSNLAEQALKQSLEKGARSILEQLLKK